MNTNEELPDFEKLAKNMLQTFDKRLIFQEDFVIAGMSEIWTTHVEPLQRATNEHFKQFLKDKEKIVDLQSENQKLREQLTESNFVLKWHLDNSQPGLPRDQEDFFNLTANAISQADKLLKTKTNP